MIFYTDDVDTIEVEVKVKVEVVTVVVVVVSTELTGVIVAGVSMHEQAVETTPEAKTFKEESRGARLTARLVTALNVVVVVVVVIADTELVMVIEVEIVLWAVIGETGKELEQKLIAGG